jgi:pyrimidine-nucleoside phosphorylase/thymidine phosphorylase
MRAWIARKRDGGELEPAAIRRLIAGVAEGTIPDYQVAALLMAILFRGLTPRELVAWTRAMIASGDRLSLRAVPGRKVDKHSTGGVGDKVTLCLAPLVAACGVRAPMLVGRALGHTGGTLDKLEAIPGFRGELDARAFVRVLRGAGFAISGQTARLVPADRALYALRDATATVESVPLIASSILSKKIAGGAGALVMDVKVGRGAFMPDLAEARRLARAIVALGRRFGLPVVALLTDMDEPLGRAVGNALEVAEALAVLRGEGPADTRALTVRLGAEMLVLGGAARDRREGAGKIEGAIASGAGLERFMRGVELQGGDVRVLEHPERLPRARHQALLRAPRAGFVAAIDARAVGEAATALGAGRARKEDRVDPAVGITLHRKRGERVLRGEPLLTVWYNDPVRWGAARRGLVSAIRISGRPPPASPLVRERIE